MTAAAQTTDIVAYVTEHPVTVLTDAEIYSQFYTRVKAELASHVPDLTTEKGRKEIASLAYKVTRSKTAIDAAGKALNEEARKQINAVDAQRRKISGELDALAKEVRKPLTDWENAEKDRQETVQNLFDTVRSISAVLADDTAATVADRIARLDALEVDEDLFGDDFSRANDAIHAAWQALSATKTRLVQQEADAAELARLRAEQETRERQEREKAEAERQEAERKRREDEAAERARADEKRRADEAIAKAEAEKTALIEKQAREERERQEAIERTRREEQARAADRTHRKRIKGEAEVVLVDLGVNSTMAAKIVDAIAAGGVPNVTMKF